MAEIEIDPAYDDFFKAVIEARARVRSDQGLPRKEREALAYFLKILTNAGSYGLFVEVIPDRSDSERAYGWKAQFFNERHFDGPRGVRGQRCPAVAIGPVATRGCIANLSNARSQAQRAARNLQALLLATTITAPRIATRPYTPLHKAPRHRLWRVLSFRNRKPDSWW